jgi:hypothetical protein
MKRRNRLATASSIVLAAVTVSGVSAAGAVARGRSQPPRPDLVIQHVQFRAAPSQSASSKISSVVIEKDGSAPFGLVFTVKNRGRAPAPRSHVKVLIVNHTLKDEIVGPIAPGRSTTVERSYTAILAGMGIYPVSICADSLSKVKESNESNNCSRKINVAAVPGVWNVLQFTAGFHSTSDGDGAIKSAGLTFNYFGIVNENGDNVFFWQANGGVIEDLSGTDSGGCDHSGHGAVSHSPWGDQIDANHGYLEIKTSLDGYSARVEDPSHGFTGTTACPGPPASSFTDTVSILPLDTLMPGGAAIFNTTDKNASILANGFTLGDDPTNNLYGSWQFKAAVPR